VNTLTVSGFVGADPEVRTTPQGKTVVNFNLGWSLGRDKPTTWFRVIVWGDDQRHFTSDLAQLVKKGDKVMVQGRVELRKWESNGKSGESLEVTADEVGILEHRSQNASQNARQNQGNQAKTQGESSNGNRTSGQSHDHDETDVPF
jgi:single stranded DNA-binding protein